MTPYRRASKALVAVLFATTVATACSESTAGRANPVGTNRPGTNSPIGPHEGTSETLPSPGTPKVQRPIETAEFEQAPCSLLTEQERQQLGIQTRGKLGKEPAGPQCVWPDQNVPYGFELSATFDKKISRHRGLSATHDVRNHYNDFEVLPKIKGFPAVIANSSKYDRRNGTCTIVVGFSDQQAVDVTAFVDIKNPNYSNACAVTREVAKAFAMTARKSGGS